MHAPDELSLFAERLEQLGAPYMVTGATAAILYGQPRVTNDLDVVLSLTDAARAALLRNFPETEFYVPPESVIIAEQARPQRGHFNLIHLGRTLPRTRDTVQFQVRMFSPGRFELFAATGDTRKDSIGNVVWEPSR